METALRSQAMPFGLPFRPGPHEALALSHSCPAASGARQQASISHR